MNKQLKKRPQQMPNQPRRNRGPRSEQSSIEDISQNTNRKKIKKPVSAGKAFALGLLASFSLLLLFSVALIFVANMRSTADAQRMETMLVEAEKRVKEASVDVAFVPAQSIRAKVQAPSASLKVFSNKNGEEEIVYGSGVVLNADGSIITNYHVIQDSYLIEVTIQDVKYTADILGIDEATDLAVIKVNGKDLPVANIGTSSNVEIGDYVMAIGNPYGLNNSFTSGVVSAKGRNITLPSGMTTIMYANMIQTDTQVSFGSSGGGLYNAKGDLIGINTLLLSDNTSSDSISYALPIDFVQPIARYLMAGQPAPHASIGLSISDVPDDAILKYGLLDNHGAYITNITPSGPAETAGIVVNDIISKYNGKEVENAQDLLYKIRATPINEQVEIVVLREAKEMVFNVKVGQDI